MEDDAGVKAPVTRLRRRLSVEPSEESKSPAALNTPTKKRGGRRAKPELELIDENTPENTTKKTRKTATKEIKDAVEEKPVTPSRRSTRIKSNTSIVSETAITVGSPRAKRAARRTSAVGSDSEAPLTPVRQTRRTRKDSTSSVDIAEIPPASKPATQITEIIVEEPGESNVRKSMSNTDTDNNISPNSLRKSPRLIEKIKKASPKSVKKDNKKAPTPEKHQNENVPSRKSVDSSISNSQEINNTSNSQEDPPTDDNEMKDRLSISSANLIKDLEVKVARIKTNNLNKTMSSMSDSNKLEKTKRKRTKSWTTLTLENESNFYSDNESSKKKIMDNVQDPGQLFKSGSGDASMNMSMQDKSDKSFSRKKKNNSGSFIVEDVNVSINNKSQNKSQTNEEISVTINDKSKNDVINLFKTGPSSDVKAMVLVDDDSDSNHGKNIQNRCESGDQCVPVVEHPIQVGNEEFVSKNQSILNNTKNKSGIDLSCEPMDVDETIPESLLVEMENNDKNSSKKNSISHFPELDIDEKEKINKSKRKSSITNKLEKSGNENKSTLILSQLKDASSNEISNLVKSPQFKNNILSKTVEDLNVTQENEINKKNISLNYVTTSTPLQQKNLQKLTLNVNTSLISANDSKNIKENLDLSKNNEKLNSLDENDSSKIVNPDIKELSTKSEKQNKSQLNVSKDKKIVDEKNNSENKSLNSSKKNLSQKQNSSDTNLESDDESLNIKRKIKYSKSKNQVAVETDSDNENESNDESDDNSNLLDDKASDAGDDYQSGDSQNEDEREYMRENEILEKGETLTSDEEFSDDSDYEKDSFVVSSAEEDNDLLDGTEDDLSMSDNELKMTAKSKKKYDERKQKEQKMASKEMFESRHKLNTSNKSSSSDLGKTKKNKKHQLSSSESESEAESKPRKNNRMRLDSTHEASMLEDANLSANICEESILNEKEITIANQSIKEIDPLTAIQVKEEPKTPKKENSSIAFINSDEMNMDVDTNEMTKTQTEIDPLGASKEDDEEVDSLSSDTEIMKNYDSMLGSLSQNNKKRTKMVDISLNLDKKTKKQKMPIVDELNLTQVKSTKKIKKIKEANESKTKDQEDDGSSDSIDLHLLFSEDSNNSEDVQQKDNAKEKIIQLKRKDGKMDIRETNNESSNQSINTSLNVSLKTNKKRKSKIEEKISSNEAEETNVNFFIDTEGTHMSLNKSVDTSMSKGKNSTKINDVNDSDEAPIEVSFQKTKKKIDAIGKDKTDSIMEKFVDKSIAKTPGSEKKKKKIKNLQVEQIDIENIADESLNISLSGKKKKNSEVEAQKSDSEYENVNNKSLNASVSSNKNKSLTEETEPSGEDPEVQITNEILIKTPSSQKKKNRVSEIHNTLIDNDEVLVNKSISKTPNSEKKKKKLSQSINIDEEHAVEETLNVSVTKTPGSQKKNSSQLQGENVQISLNTSKIKTPGSQKKIAQEPQVNESQVIIPEKKETSLKKRKRKASLNKTVEELNCEDGDGDVSKKLNDSLVVVVEGSQKKKLKVSQKSEEKNTVLEDKQVENILQSSGDKKKKKLKKQDTFNIHTEIENPGTDMLKASRNKRKQREDDDENTVSKVLMQSSFDKQVPRLPARILSQLDENPNKDIHISKKAKIAVSTTQFLVEETKKRKNKPSYYLEESVYLNDDETESRKSKKRLQKPKVLPFVPTVLTSGSGYTTNFKVNVLPRETKFIAQTSNISNFKEDYILNKKIKRQGTYEMYKRNRNIKISKF